MTDLYHYVYGYRSTTRHISLIPRLIARYIESSYRLTQKLIIHIYLYIHINYTYFQSIEITADVFICCIITSVIVSVIFAALIIVQIDHTKCPFPSDASFIFYFIRKIYFLFLLFIISNIIYSFLNL